ncbi:peptidase M14 [Blattabacterium sp. (Cryptocercus kyebangensis)]|uniref:M14 family zinc carboxypeptidase n=1 Tax=Blattabacterium sp. (Cryptocercus kyebangensis) TaxID=298656 RepID=UPI000D7C47DF|nr:M14 family zinc carboxypeptidase [Blattabacterium sp. (Cryptocercus kyebangensis)]AWU43510.1 peptidase M14 [Blattabacterium sp. (Cryptocercus kyebangensis)]
MFYFDLDTLFRSYNSLIKDDTITSSRIFKYSKLLKMVKKYENICSIIPVGFSIEERIIFKFQWGKGDFKIFIWSQMHGNETTGTKSMFDIFHFFSKEKNHDLVRFLRKKLTILFIPMLNPDGSEKFQRRNAVNIDLNRDAIRLQSPEIKILFHEIKKSNPHILFNLHDQKSIYNIGNKYFNPAILSFLSPSVEGDKKITDKRKKSMGLIYSIEKKMRGILPNIGSIGRFSDKLYPTATGDNFQKLGYPTILFEAGCLPKDTQKEIVRKYNTFSILLGFYFLSTKESNLEKEYKSYFSIPENKNNLFDKIYRKVQIEKGKYQFLVDIGIRIIEKFDPIQKNINLVSKIVDIGDLSHFFAYEDTIFNGKKFYRKRKKEGENFPEIGDQDLFNIF